MNLSLLFFVEIFTTSNSNFTITARSGFECSFSDKKEISKFMGISTEPKDISLSIHYSRGTTLHGFSGIQKITQSVGCINDQ